MSNNDGVWGENEDGTWSEAVPLPFYGLRKGCHCGEKFWKEENYRKHYKAQHTDGKRYNRTPKGLVLAGSEPQLAHPKGEHKLKASGGK